MRRGSETLIVLISVVGAALGGCAQDNREWMKLNQKYTTEEFRADRAACLKDGRVDEVCMRDRGWVAVNPGGTVETAKDPLARDLNPPASRSYRR